jgi:nucleolin
MNQKLFVANLGWSVSEDDLRTLFSEAGEVMSVKIPTRREDGKSRGFGFVEMVNESQAQEALNRFNQFSYQGREMVVSFQEEGRSVRSSGGSSGEGASPEKNSKLFVRNVSRHVSESDLMALFQQAGLVNSVKIPVDRESGEPKGFAFVEMASTEDAQQVINSFNHEIFQNKELLVDFQDPNRAKTRAPRQSVGAY